MAKPEDELQKHTLNLFRGDYERVQDLFPDIGAGPVIRRVLRSYLERIEMGEIAADPNVEIKL